MSKTKYISLTRLSGFLLQTSSSTFVSLVQTPSCYKIEKQKVETCRMYETNDMEELEVKKFEWVELILAALTRPFVHEAKMTWSSNQSRFYTFEVSHLFVSWATNHHQNPLLRKSPPIPQPPDQWIIRRCLKWWADHKDGGTPHMFELTCSRIQISVALPPKAKKSTPRQWVPILLHLLMPQDLTQESLATSAVPFIITFSSISAPWISLLLLWLLWTNSSIHSAKIIPA